MVRARWRGIAILSVCTVMVLAQSLLPSMANASEEGAAAADTTPATTPAATSAKPRANSSTSGAKASATATKKSAPAKKSIEDEPLDKSMFQSDSGKKKAAARKKDSNGSIMRMLLGLAFVLGVIWAVHWLLKKYGQGRAGAALGAAGVIDVLATTQLAADRSLHLVRVGDEVVLIGATSQNVSHLRTLTTNASTDATAASMGGQDFQRQLYGAIATQGGSSAPSSMMGTTSLPPSVLAAMSGGTVAQQPATSDSFVRKFLANLQQVTAR